MRALGILLSLAVVGNLISADSTQAKETTNKLSPYLPPREVKVLPVFFVPESQPSPTAEQSKNLMRHLKLAQSRFRVLLRNQDTFTLAQETPVIVKSARKLDYFRTFLPGAGEAFSKEILEHFKFNRFNCPYIFVMIVMNPKENFPGPGGRPFNGGFNTGGGIITIPSHFFDTYHSMQSTMQHELGHSFGLPHVDAYGYDQEKNDSVMAYNVAHVWDFFKPGKTQTILIPEDLRGLALNKRVFPKLQFDPAKDIPKGYAIKQKIRFLHPQDLPGQPPAVKVTTTSGEAEGSKVGRIVQGQIIPSEKTVDFDPATMWHSDRAPSGWVAVDISFPFEVELTRMRIHSQHEGKHHAAKAVRIWTPANVKTTRKVLEQTLSSNEETVSFPASRGRTWKLEFQTAPNGWITIRGLQFFFGDAEIFPPLVSYAAVGQGAEKEKWAGEWLADGDVDKPCAIFRHGRVMLVINQHGSIASGRVTGLLTCQILKGEGWDSGLKGEVRDKGKTLVWGDGSKWTRP